VHARVRVDRDHTRRGAGETEVDGSGRRATGVGNLYWQQLLLLQQQPAQPCHAADPRRRPYLQLPFNLSDDQRVRLGLHEVGSYFRPNAIGRYSFDAENNIVFNKIERLFDLAIMMDCSQCPVHPQLRQVFFEQMKLHADTVRKHDAKPVFFMSWAYSDVPAMTAQLADAYTSAANDSNAFVIPAGLAFAKAVERRPELNLYAADKRHPSLAGTYLAAATTYGALFRKSPVRLKYTAGLGPETAEYLQSTAWQTLQEYFPSLGASARD
jgi:hypothetical protein